MLDQFLAQEKINDAHREAEKARLVKDASRSRENQARQYLKKFACQLGLIQAC